MKRALGGAAMNHSYICAGMLLARDLGERARDY
jgi:hypothetical protein